MAPKPRTVTAKTLQALLTRIGSASSGTKNILHARFQQDVCRPRLFDLRPDWKKRLKDADPRFRKLRILSIDMGIKNLAYCHAEVSFPGGDAMKPTMDIEKWEKLSLVDATRDLRRPLPQEKKESGAVAEEEVDSYSLDVLSQTAYHFITRTALQLAPDIILIERQRWRSASSAAIQQWTVRVNTLEAMLWAILETLRTERLTNISRAKDEVRKRDYEIHGVDPKRVGQYWLGQHAKAAVEGEESCISIAEADEDLGGKVTKKIPRSKAEKKAKIALLRSWLSAEPASTAASMPKSGHTISFNIGHGAITARRALILPKASQKRGKRTKASIVGGEDNVQEQDLKKLDDITDCFLQATAWVAWETNRLQLWDVWDQRRGKRGDVPPLDDEILREMVGV
ncbi:ribonuclease H-like protein, partial [Ophiobolus disseminans]